MVDAIVPVRFHLAGCNSTSVNVHLCACPVATLLRDSVIVAGTLGYAITSIQMFATCLASGSESQEDKCVELLDHVVLTVQEVCGMSNLLKYSSMKIVMIVKMVKMA